MYGCRRIDIRLAAKYCVKLPVGALKLHVTSNLSGLR